MMAELTGDQFLVLVISLAYLLVVAIYALWMTRLGESLLHTVEREIPAEKWQAIGAPSSLREAINDPRRRWVKFIREKAYRNFCSPVTASKIDTFLLHASLGLFALATVGGVILYRFWPFFKPLVFGD